MYVASLSGTTTFDVSKRGFVADLSQVTECMEGLCAALLELLKDLKVMASFKMQQAGERAVTDIPDEAGQHASCGAWRKSEGLEGQGFGCRLEGIDTLETIFAASYGWILREHKSCLHRMMELSDEITREGMDRSNNLCGGQVHMHKSWKGLVGG